jgi:hypothetical protein
MNLQPVKQGFGLKPIEVVYEVLILTNMSDFLSVVLIGFWIFVTGSPQTFAGDIRLSVSDGPIENCGFKPTESFQKELKMTSDEAILAMKRYFSGTSTFEESGAFVNAQVRFCSTLEKAKAFAALLDELNEANPDKKVFELISNYYRLEPLPTLMSKRLRDRSLPEISRRNLEKAQKRAMAVWAKK